MNNATVENKTIAQIVAEKFPFNVDKFRLSGPDNMATDIYGLFRDDTLEEVSKCGHKKGYVPHNTDDVVALVEASAEAFGDDVAIKAHFNKGHFVSIAPSDQTRREIIRQNDTVFPRVIIAARYDGKAFKATLGLYRDLCDNLEMMQKVEASSVSINHKGHLRKQMSQLVDTFATLTSSWDDLIDAINTMQSQTFRFDEFMEAVFPTPEDQNNKNKMGRRDKMLKTIFDRLDRELFITNQARIGRHGYANGWMLFNAVQGYVQHDATRRGALNNTDFERILSTASNSAVQNAERIALGA